MPSCWGHLSWEGLWHKPKQMLIAEPHEAAVQAPKHLTVLDQPCLGPPPTPCPWPKGPVSAQPQAPWGALEVFICPDCCLGILDWSGTWPVALHMPDGDWAVILTWHCWLTQRSPSVGFVVTLETWWTWQITSEHFMFQRLTLIFVYWRV